MEFMGINAGPEFQLSEAVSFEVKCKDQEEIDCKDDADAQVGYRGLLRWL